MNKSEPLPLLINAQQLNTHLVDDNLLILDVSSADNYAKGHIPGAIHIPPSSLICGIKPATGKLPSPQLLSDLMGSVGLTPQKHVIAYDDEGSGWAGRLIWTLDVLGHQHYSCLDGGILAWRGANLATETTANLGQVTPYNVTIDRKPIIDAEELMAQIGKPDLAIWDARSAEEYAGTKVLAQRGGHIPGAQNYEWTDLMDKANNLQLLPLDQIQAQLNQLGISKDKQIVTHCQTHHRSGLTYFVAKLLGYTNIKAYDGSWSEWGNREDTPIE